MTILITGGMGFIGSHIVNHYLSKNQKVIVFDSLQSSTISEASKVLDYNNPNLEFHQIDLSLPTSDQRLIIERAISESSIVYHFASAIGVKLIHDNPNTSLRNNLFMSQNIYPILEKYNRKLVFASTSEVYGENQYATETDTLKIGPPTDPRWGYACSKLINEFEIKSYNFPAVIARIFNVVGAGQKKDLGMVLPNFIYQAKNGLDISVFGTGEQVRSFCDVDDAVNMLVLLGENSIHDGEIYNVGNEQQTISISQLAELVKKTINSNISINYTPYHEIYTGFSRDIITRKVNSTKIMQFYTCRIPLVETIQQMAIFL